MTHPEVERAGNDGHRAVGFEMNGAEFLAGRGRNLKVTANAEIRAADRAFCFRACVS